MKIYMVVAMSENHVIGSQGELPWHLPKDLKRFKERTMGKTILMGRKTFQSINKALPGRNNLVMTKDLSFAHENVQAIHTIDELRKLNLEELYVIGGEDIYRLFLPFTSTIFLTLVHAVVLGDTFFPKLDDFIELDRQYCPADDKHKYAFSFIEYLRKNPEHNIF